MLRNVYLEGEMGEKFGTGFQVNAPKIADIIKCIECNHPSFKKYLVDCHEKEIGCEIDIAKQKLEYEAEMLMNLQEGDVTITPLPAGSKSGGAKIFAAIALMAFAVFAMPALLGAVGAGGMGPATAGLLGTGGQVMGISTATLQMGVGMLAVNIGMMGISQVMAPDPATDADQEESYLFNGNQQNIVEGDPVPVLYGKLRIPGQPINFEVAGAGSEAPKTVFLYRDGESNKNGGFED